MSSNVAIGNLIHMAERGNFQAIIHGANCTNTMGSGIAKELRARYPGVYHADTEFSQTVNSEERLGQFSEYNVSIDWETNFTIYNAYTQLTYGRDSSKRYVSYEAINEVMHRLASYIPNDQRIGYPMIGAGLGGGDWAVISDIMKSAFKNHDHTLVLLGDK